MSISEKITRAVAEFVSVQAIHTNPTKLFLGLRDWEDLEAMAFNECHFVLRNVSGKQRSEYRGMKVYLVDDASYVGVAA